MIDYQAVGTFISELRKINRLTQTELAERLNITHQSVSKWENGITLPDTETLFTLSKLFNVKIDDILNGSISSLKTDTELGCANKDTLYQNDIVRLEFGLGLIPHISQKGSITFLENLRDMRKRIEDEFGRDIPAIRVLDNKDLGDLQYRIIVKGKAVINNNLKFVPSDDRVTEVLKYLEFVIKSNIDKISAIKL